jgi:hypothetical protein
MTTAGGAPGDLSRADWATQQRDALDAWRTNPLARRLVSLVTAYTVGDGIRLSSNNAHFDAFLRTFQAQPFGGFEQNLAEWSDELSRSGELFLALFTDGATGMSMVRAVPAIAIDEIRWLEGDYRTELAYRDLSAGVGAERWWRSHRHPDAAPDEPVLLHFAVNRPVGALRGESDLAPILPWLRRYTRWLEDRVRLNASVRAFLWVVNAPARVRTQLAEQFRQPPEPGTVIIADEQERWSAVAPDLHASDSAADGRAIRWMIAAGGPGTALLDLGEGEDSNLATGQVMQEQKRRFLRRRQRVLVELLSELALTAYARSIAITGAPEAAATRDDLTVTAPDISPEDNAQLAQAAHSIVSALQGMATLTGGGASYRRMALRLFARFAGEALGVDEEERILAEGAAQEERRPAQTPAGSRSDEQPTTVRRAR